jgi:GT2 family glycosyltransferase
MTGTRAECQEDNRRGNERVAATVTAIIPTYNRRELVVQSARSVLGQSCTGVECLVIDNGSSDGTAEALRALGDDRLVVLVRDHPLGAAKARNVGLAATRTPWVAFLDNDDLWAPKKLEYQLTALTRYPSARWCATGCAYVGADLSMRPGGRLNDGPVGPVDGQFFSSQDLLGLLSRDNVVPGGGSSVLVSTELAQDAGGFHDDVPGCEDWDMWVRLARLSPMAYVDRPLAAWRMWEGQGSTDVPMMLRSANQVRLKYFPELGPVDDQYAQIWWASAARRHLAGRNRLEASSHFLRLARIGRSPGQLAYALAALVAPSVAERRLQRIEPGPDPEWSALAEPWLETWSHPVEGGATQWPKGTAASPATGQPEAPLGRRSHL